MTTLHYEFESDDAATPRDSNLTDDQVVAGLYQDIDIDIDDRLSNQINPQPASVPSKSSATRNFNFSIPIHTKKLNEQKPFLAPFFSASKPGVEPATAVQSGSTKMESPTFCKGDSELISPSFPAAFEDPPRDNKLSIKPGLLSDSDIKSPASQESAIKPVSVNKQEQKPRLSAPIQEAYGRKSQNSGGSSKTNMINPAPEYGILKPPTVNLYSQKSDRTSSIRSAGLEKKDANYNKLPAFFFGEKKNGLNNELERPESSPDVDKSRNTSSAIQTSRTVGVEVSYMEHADPLSLGNFDDKFKLRSKPVSTQVSSRKTLREAPKTTAIEGQGLGLVSSKSNSSLKTAKNVVKKEERLSQQSGDNRSSLYKKIQAQGKTPKEIEIQQAAPADFRPKLEKMAKPVTPTRNPVRAHTPKMVGPENVAKQMITSNTDHSLKAWKVQNGGGASPKRIANGIEGNAVKEGSKSPSNSNSPKKNGMGGNGFFKELVKYNTLNIASPKSDSPKMKTSNSQKAFHSMNSVTLESPEKSRIKKQESNRMTSASTTNKSTELKRARANTTQNSQQTTINRSTTPNNGRQSSKSPKVAQQRQYQFTDEIKVAGEVSPRKGQQLQVIEANLREIQGKLYSSPKHQNSPKHPNSPKHIRYPSFGSLEKERRPSSRRTISQDSQAGLSTSQQFANSLDKERKLTPTPKSMNNNKPYIPLGKIEEVKETQLLQQQASSKPLHDIKLSHMSLMKSLDLRKNLTGVSQEDSSTPVSSRSHRAVLVSNTDANIPDLMPHTVHGGSQPSSGLLNRGGIVDIYQRNSQWLSSKQNKLRQEEMSKKKEEMKECTFKPYRSVMTMNCESEYSQKNFNNYGIGRASVESNQGAEKRSLSKEKKTLNSYGGIHNLRKEAMTPKPAGNIKSPKSSFFPKREPVEIMSHYTNPH